MIDPDLLRIAVALEMCYDEDYDHAVAAVEENISLYGEDYYKPQYPGDREARRNPPVGPGYIDRATQLASEDPERWQEAIGIAGGMGLRPGTDPTFLTAAIQAYYGLGG